MENLRYAARILEASARTDVEKKVIIDKVGTATVELA